MPFLSLNLYHKAPTLRLAPDRVVTELKQLVSDLQCDGIDQLRLRFENAKQNLSEDNEGKASVLRSMERDIVDQGPALAFEFAIDAQNIQGVVRQGSIQFKYADSLSDAALDQLKTLMRTVVPLSDRIPFDTN